MLSTVLDDYLERAPRLFLEPPSHGIEIYIINVLEYEKERIIIIQQKAAQGTEGRRVARQLTL